VNATALRASLLNPGTAGTTTGVVSVGYFSDGTGTTGGPLLSTGSSLVTVTGDVYRLAVGTLDTMSIDLGNIRQGGTFALSDVVVRNAAVSSDVFSDDLGAVISSVNAGNYQVSLYAWYSSFDDPFTFLDLFIQKPRGSITGYANADYDTAFRSANRTPDPIARAKALAQAEALLMRDMPAIPLFFAEGQKLVGPRVGGWVDNARGANLSRYLSVRG
jgi:ABC-type oligopeptide transport system substrate-binding subunit